MPREDAGEVTLLLKAVKDGLPGAPDRLMSLVYDRLKAIARNRVGSGSKSGMDATTLVHEAYLRMFDQQDATWENRNHFFWAAARAMRDILVERARRNAAIKNGGGRRHVSIHDDIPGAMEATDLLALNESLKRLEKAHPKAAEVVMLRFFAGLDRAQAAEVTGQSETALWREWVFAKAWLLADLNGSKGDEKP